MILFGPEGKIFHFFEKFFTFSPLWLTSHQIYRIIIQGVTDMRKVRIILYQKPLGIPVVKKDVQEMKLYKPHFVCFPEYFFVQQRLGNHRQTDHNQHMQMKRMEILSRELDTIVIGGTMPELSGGIIYNTSFVYDRGVALGFYRKKNLFFAEVGKVTPGKAYRTFRAGDITFGVLICADVFDENAFLYMKEHGAAIIFSPTFSLKKDESRDEKFKRDNDIYVQGAVLADAVIVKVCGVKSDYRNFLQARSLIAGKDGIRYRVQPEEEDTAMIIKQEVET
jgi:predicted amidohydrolase